MHEIIKFRSSTPQQELLKPGLTETLQLLQKWNLLELQNIFKEHDITLRSLIFLTEEEICELIPKIGLRTIFRAMLKEWRQTNNSLTYSRASTSSNCEDENDSFLDHIELKTEYDSQDIYTNTTYSKDKIDFQSNYVNSLEQAQKIGQSLDEIDYESLPAQVSKESNTQLRKRRNKVYSGEPFNVLLILSSCLDGQTALEFYKIHNSLDIKNRKRVVNLLIRAVVERKVEKYTAIFHDMTRQLMELFPTEKYETYFVPHNGSNSARGALYYRYSNYTRQLRKEGLLAYKKRKPRNYV